MILLDALFQFGKNLVLLGGFGDFEGRLCAGFLSLHYTVHWCV